jgi:hypothetical protein
MAAGIALFRAEITGKYQYAVTRDGQRFLILIR